jgi:preprotein translocase subunit SecE
MGKARTETAVWSELLRFDLYKRTQGRLARQLTALALGLVIFFGAWTLSQGPLAEYGAMIRQGLPLLICAIGAWLIFRLVNYPRFADFLISVQAEMDKVSWADRSELYRATIVVLSTMFFLGFVLFLYDIFWAALFRWIGVLQV